MSAGRWLAALAAAAALVVAVRWYSGAPTPAPERAPTAASRPPPLGPAEPWPAPVAGPAAPAPAAALPRQLLKAALTQRLHGTTLPPALLESLLAGDVASVAARLQAAPERGAAAALADLAGLCRELAQPGADDGATASRAALSAATRDASTVAALDQLLAAQRAARSRLAAGCAAASFDPAAIERRLRASAAAGDAASLERLALAGTEPPGRLESAALLGATRAQLRLALDHLNDQPDIAHTWLQAAARSDPDAASFYAACLLAGCGGPPDAAAARATLEAAAARGAPAALGQLLSAPGADVTSRWSPADALVSPVPPRDPDALGLAPAERYAWAVLAAGLARDGCFGFETGIAAEALAAPERLERALSPGEVAAATAAAGRRVAADAAAAHHARGCD